MTSSSDGRTTTPITLATADGIASITIPQGTGLYADDARTQPVSGTVTVTASATTSVDGLPETARTATLAGGGETISSVGAVVDLVMNGAGATVRTFDAPIAVNLKLPQGFAAGGEGGAGG